MQKQLTEKEKRQHTITCVQTPGPPQSRRNIIIQVKSMFKLKLYLSCRHMLKCSFFSKLWVWNMMIDIWGEVAWIEQVYGRELHTLAPVPDLYCADSGAKWHHQCKMTVLGQWLDVFFVFIKCFVNLLAVFFLVFLGTLHTYIRLCLMPDTMWRMVPCKCHSEFQTDIVVSFTHAPICVLMGMLVLHWPVARALFAHCYCIFCGFNLQNGDGNIPSVHRRLRTSALNCWNRAQYLGITLCKCVELFETIRGSLFAHVCPCFHAIHKTCYLQL